MSDPKTTPWGTPVERERWRRIRVSIAAYAYEVRNHSIMDDASYDELAYSLNPRMVTGHTLDQFFARHFDPSTGMWINQHPEIDRIAAIYERHYGKSTDVQ